MDKRAKNTNMRFSYLKKGFHKIPHFSLLLLWFWVVRSMASWYKELRLRSGHLIDRKLTRLGSMQTQPVTVGPQAPKRRMPSFVKLKSKESSAASNASVSSTRGHGTSQGVRRSLPRHLRRCSDRWIFFGRWKSDVRKLVEMGRSVFWYRA